MPALSFCGLKYEKDSMIFKLFKLMLFGAMIFAVGCAKPYTREKLGELNNIPQSFRNETKLQDISGSNEKIDTSDTLLNFLYMFKDEQLKKLIDDALEKNTDLLTLASKIKQAKSEARSSFSEMFPKVDIGLNYNYGDQNSQTNSTQNFQNFRANTTQNSLDFSANFSWEIDLFGRLDSLRKASKEQILYAEQNLASGRVTLIADVAKYYFTIRDASSNINLSKLTIKNLENIVKVYKSKQELGLIEDSEVMMAEMDVLNELNNLKSLENTLEENRNALAVLLDDNALKLDFANEYAMPSPKIPKINDIPISAIFNRPDVLASIFTLNTEIYRKNSSEAALYPSLRVSGNIGQIIASSTGVGDLIWQIAGSLVAPLLNRTALYSDFRIREEARKQAEYSLRKTVSSALSEVETTVFQVDSSKITVNNSEKYLKNSQSTMNVVRNKFNTGRVDELELLKSENSNLTAARMLSTSKFNNIISSINLYKAFGGSFTEPEKESDNETNNK